MIKILKYTLSKIHTPIAVIGGGTGGLNVVSHLKNMKGIYKN